MKKQLLIGAALLVATGMSAQSGKPRPSTNEINLFEKIAAKYDNMYHSSEQPVPVAKEPRNIIQSTQLKSASSTINWMHLSSSMNIFSVYENSSKPLQYNDELNAVSFIHRKSTTYPLPIVYTNTSASSGAIIAMVTTDCGQSWDSTCVWDNGIQFARYPQGAIYNPMGNTNIANSYITAVGPVTSGNGWIGNFAASKKLDATHGSGYNNVASTLNNAQQFFPNTAPFNYNTLKFDAPNFDFSATDDGVMRAIGMVMSDVNGTGPARKYRGAKIVKGVFSSGGFNWSADSLIIAPLTISVSTTGDAQLFEQPRMAWSENGMVGYVVHIGCRLNQSTVTTAPQNTGFQPIVHKTTDGGQTWVLLPPIDFTQPAFTYLINHIASINTNTAISIPLFDPSEGIDCTVDKNNNLHIVSTVLGTSRQHPDSLGFTFGFVNQGETYSYAHVPGARPYIYDFIGSATGWNMVVVDSMSSEAPGIRQGQNGFSDNPWSATSGTNNNEKIPSAARLQLSRTPDGRFIIYSWAETDTNFTSQKKKWNVLPNLKVKAYDMNTNLLSNNKINLTTNFNPISGNAQMHHISPKCAFIGITGGGPGYSLDTKLPATVSNNQNFPLDQNQPNDHWYTCADLTFHFGTVGLNENKVMLKNIGLFPNPAKTILTLNFGLNSSTDVIIEVINLTGQSEKKIQTPGAAGTNNVTIDVSGLSAGIYLLKMQASGEQHTLKLLIE